MKRFVRRRVGRLRRLLGMRHDEFGAADELAILAAAAPSPERRSAALAILERAQESDAHFSKNTWLLLGDALLRQGAVRAAVTSYVHTDALSADARFEFGQRLYDYFDHASPDWPTCEIILQGLGDRERLWAPDLRKKAMSHLLSLPCNEDIRRAVGVLAEGLSNEALAQLADALIRRGDDENALWCLETIAARSPRGDDAKHVHMALGDARLRLGNPTAAVDAYRNAHACDPDSKLDFGRRLLDFVDATPLSLAELRALFEQLTSPVDITVPDLCVAMLRQAARLPRSLVSLTLADALALRTPHDKLMQLGNAALAEARHASAIYLYEQCIKRDPQDVLTRLQLGITHFLANDHASAERHFALLPSLQAIERERWGVADVSARVLHHTWLQAFGHITCLDIYIKAMKLGWIPEARSILPFDASNPPAGWALLRYWAQYLEVVGVHGETAPVVDKLLFGEEANSLDGHQRNLRRASLECFYWALPDADGRVRYISDIGSLVQQEWQRQSRPPLLTVSDDEENAFRALMEQCFGLPKDAWFVLLHVRESSFKPGWESHHQYTRNASIDDYQRAIDEIIARGGWVIRAGDPAMRRISTKPGLIDYATSAYRSPELDILLCATCRFFVGTNSGFSLTPALFGKRCVLTNWSPLANPNWYPDDIFTPKLVRERKTQRLLTASEMYASKAGWSQFERDFQDEWEKLDNDPEDIVEAVREMMDRLAGVAPTPLENERQDRFKEIVLRHGGYLGSRLGDRFLAKHGWFLGEDEVRQPALAPARRVG